MILQLIVGENQQNYIKICCPLANVTVRLYLLEKKTKKFTV